MNIMSAAMPKSQVKSNHPILIDDAGISHPIALSEIEGVNILYRLCGIKARADCLSQITPEFKKQ